MDCSPHSLHEILVRIREQMRCPQCGTKMEVDFPSVKIAGDNFMLLQLKCGSCSAFIVLHVNMTERHEEVGAETAKMRNASSALSLSKEDMTTLRSALQQFDGSFERLFQETKRSA